MCNLGNEIYDSGEFNATLSSIRNLMDSLNIDVNMAMKLLKIPDDMASKYLAVL